MATRCTAKTQKGKRCKKISLNGKDLCSQHQLIMNDKLLTNDQPLIPEILSVVSDFSDTPISHGSKKNSLISPTPIDPTFRRKMNQILQQDDSMILNWIYESYVSTVKSWKEDDPLITASDILTADFWGDKDTMGDKITNTLISKKIVTGDHEESTHDFEMAIENELRKYFLKKLAKLHPEIKSLHRNFGV